MIALWLGIVGLTILAVIFIMLPVWRAVQQEKLAVDEAPEDRKTQNIEIFRERLAELDAERKAGSLAAAEYDQLKLELEKGLLLDAAEESAQSAKQLNVSKSQVITTALLAGIVVVTSLGLYNHLGRATDLEVAMNPPVQQPGEPPQTIEDAIAMLKSELAANPENPEGWYLLASTYINVQRFDEGVEAFSEVLARLPDDAPQYPGVLGQFAQAKYFANGNQMSDEIRELIERTLALDPFEMSAIGLKGIEAFEAGEYQIAIDEWSKGLANAEGGAAESLQAGIDEARQRLAQSGVEPAIAGADGVEAIKSAPQAAQENTDLNAAEIKVLITVADELLTSIEPNQTLFVLARPMGARMPLAAERITVNDLPAVITLNDEKAMSPQMVLSQFDQVEVTARISLSGQPAPTAGDMFGTLQPVNTRGNNHVIQLVIDQMVD